MFIYALLSHFYMCEAVDNRCGFSAKGPWIMLKFTSHLLHCKKYFLIILCVFLLFTFVIGFSFYISLATLVFLHTPSWSVCLYAIRNRPNRPIVMKTTWKTCLFSIVFYIVATLFFFRFSFSQFKKYTAKEFRGPNICRGILFLSQV